MNDVAVAPPARRDLQAVAQFALALRRHVVRMVGRLGQGYVQQGLGAAEIFATLFAAELRLAGSTRDRFLLSTAHNSAVFHAALAEAGLIDRDALDTYCVDGSPLEVNVSERLGAVVEATLGSLGQGLSVGLGMALAARRAGADTRVYVLLGDGELQEGQVWEAAMAAATWRADNLCLVIDCNDMQVDGRSVQRMEPVAGKFAAFGWHVVEVDGHDARALFAAFDEARTTRGRPTAILARTLVGKGVDFLEGQFGHNMKLSRADAEAALRMLGDTRGLG